MVKTYTEKAPGKMAVNTRLPTQRSLSYKVLAKSIPSLTIISLRMEPIECMTGDIRMAGWYISSSLKEFCSLESVVWAGVYYLPFRQVCVYHHH